MRQKLKKDRGDSGVIAASAPLLELQFTVLMP